MIRRAFLQDARALAELAARMWERHTVEDLEAEFRETIEKDDAAFFLKFVENEAVGFAECRLRHDYVEGTKSSPVGYLEGVFVAEDFRGRGFARELLAACEAWAKEKGCTEFASDCELTNDASLRFHLAAGFEEANRIICFRKKL